MASAGMRVLGGGSATYGQATSPPHIRRNGSTKEREDSASPRIAHTLTACCRCRQRKTRCDPGLPRCGPCERTNSICEYYDPAKNTKIPRNYVVHLQHKVNALEAQLALAEKEDELDQDPETMARAGAAVRIQESDESKFLGPSSGIAITRLVMQLAKQFTDSKSITEIISRNRAKQIKEQFDGEAAKPTSKVYPSLSNLPMEDLPNRELTTLLLQLYNAKVQPMYPVLHEPTFAHDVEEVYNGSPDPHKNFLLRMVIAISLQKMDTLYAGLADSYYLAALRYLEACVKTMDIRTLQCLALIAEYSLLTPTRTAVYYTVGMAVRLVQALGYSEEKTITLGRGGKEVDILELDMRRRIFWCTMTMEYGLAHSLGRPSSFAMGQQHIDVGWFHTIPDEYITKERILDGAPPFTLKKWIAVHFFKMRLLQLEIRRKLYQRRRPEPKDENDPWFREMEQKMIAWRDSSPQGEETGINKMWFIGRYNTMVVFLWRPSPQIPKPSVRAAFKCFDAVEFNIHMQMASIQKKAVDITWIFTQSIFMTVNTMLWTLAYQEIRRAHPREEVEGHLKVALDAIALCSDRWPGVLSAIDLYENLINACMKIYDKDGDIPLSASSPSDQPSPSSTFDGLNRSRTTSPATISSATASGPSLATPPERQPAFGYMFPHTPSNHASPDQPSPMPYHTPPPASAPSPAYSSSTMSASTAHQHPSILPRHSAETVSHIHYGSLQPMQYDPSSQYNPLPQTFPDLIQWNPMFTMQQTGFNQPQNNAMFGDGQLLSSPTQMQQDMAGQDYFMQPFWSEQMPMQTGINHAQQNELMKSLETDGMGDIENMIQASNAIWNSVSRQY